MPDPAPASAKSHQKNVETRKLQAAASTKRRARRVALLACLCAVASMAVTVVLAVRLLGEPKELPRPPAKRETSAPRPVAAERPAPPPAPIDSVLAEGEATKVTAVFFVPVEKALAEAVGSYAIEPEVKILSATLGQDGRTVTLTTSPLKEGVTYFLRAKGVRAMARERRGVPFRYVATHRTTEGLVALYDFEEGEGAAVKDVSAIGEPLHLEVKDEDHVKWVPGGLAIQSSTMLAASGPAAKIIEACRLTNAITIEAWIKPANTTQGGPSRIVVLSKNPLQRNFTLGQQGGSYDVRLRTTATGENGTNPSFSTQGGVATQLSHVVYTRDEKGTAAVYINGSLAHTGPIRGSLSNWADDMQFALANEFTSARAWLGELHLVAIYNRALTAADVARNHAAGPEGKTPKP